MTTRENLIILIFGIIQLASCTENGSLVFVIDNTLSMTNDIQQVKENVDEIITIAFSEPTSRFKNMVLVTFNDPNVSLEIATENKNEFKRKINALMARNTFGNMDCPEMSMFGILVALQNSLPGSFILVFTDASAKDYMKSNEVQNICQEKQSQIIFILNGDCGDQTMQQFKVYYDIATACRGAVINVEKNDVSEDYGKVLLDEQWQID